MAGTTPHPCPICPSTCLLDGNNIVSQEYSGIPDRCLMRWCRTPPTATVSLQLPSKYTQGNSGEARESIRRAYEGYLFVKNHTSFVLLWVKEGRCIQSADSPFVLAWWWWGVRGFVACTNTRLLCGFCHPIADFFFERLWFLPDLAVPYLTFFGRILYLILPIHYFTFPCLTLSYLYLTVSHLTLPISIPYLTLPVP